MIKNEIISTLGELVFTIVPDICIYEDEPEMKEVVVMDNSVPLTLTNIYIDKGVSRRQFL